MFRPVAAILLVAAFALPLAGASTLNLAAPGGAVVFTFNEGLASQMDAAALLESQGDRGTFYITSGALRSGPSNPDHLAAADVAALAARGHDVESAAVSKVDLTSLSDAQLQDQLVASQASLQALTGMPVRHLEYPLGASDARVRAAVAQVYDSGRTTTTRLGDFAPSVDSYQVPGFVLFRTTTLSKAEYAVDYAASHGVTVVFSLDGVTANPGRYDWPPARLASLLDYVHAKGVPVRTVAALFGSAPGPNAPAAPTLAAAGAVGQVNLSWTRPADGGSAITGYRLYRGTTSGGESLLASLGVANAYVDANATVGTRYYYQVSAANGIGEGARSGEVSAVPASSPSTPTAPGAPTLLASAGPSRVNLSWTTPPDGGSTIVSYRVYRATSSGAEMLLANLGANTSYVDFAVTAGTRYYYQVDAANGVGPGPRSNEASVVPTVMPPPPAVGGTVVFSFDDGYANQIAAADTLASHGFRGTFYVVTSWLGSSGQMTPAQVKALSDAGHDVESHTVTHPHLATLSVAKLTVELRDSQAYLQNLTGKPVHHLAYPYGDHDLQVEQTTALYYDTGRIYLTNPPLSNLPTLYAQSGSDRYLVPGIGVAKATTLAAAEGYVDYAVSHNTTVVLTFHAIASSVGTYDWAPTNFGALVDYTAAKGVVVKTMAQAYG